MAAVTIDLGEFRIVRGGNRVKGRITALDFRRADLDLLQAPFKRIPWDMASLS